jgi:hypothetical protein
MDVLDSIVGARVERIRRVLCVNPDGTIEGGEGDLELTFADGNVRWFRVGGDGETLNVRDEPWTDPFAAPLSPENAEFVRRSGKWTAFDLTEVPPWSALVGPILAVDPVNRAGKMTGAVLVMETGRRLEIDCDGDEISVKILDAV